MSKLFKLLLIFGLVGLLAGTVAADKARKLPTSAYIKSAKIHILSGDMERYAQAEAMLDSLFMYYGPHAEGIYWIVQMSVDRINRVSTPMEKKPFVTTMVAYRDSLHMCCENKKIEKKYRKDCDKYKEQVDSIGVAFWREFYNAGIEQLNSIADLNNSLRGETDSSMIAFYREEIASNFDSCVANMELAIAIDSSDERAYVAIGSAYQGQEKYDEAIKWKTKGLNMVENKTDMMLSIAYDYVNSQHYEEAIPYLAGYLEDSTGDLSNMFNLTICLNNVGMYDSAAAVFHTMLAADSQNVDALSGLGRYYNEMGRWAADSTSRYDEAGDTKMVAEWQAHRGQMFDSARVYFKKSFEIDPSDEFNTDMYALVSAIAGRFDDAARGYEKLTQLQPTNPDHWLNLGDCYLGLKEFDKAITAYEKVVELTPDNKAIWEQLANLYNNQGMKSKEAEARKHF